MAEGRSNVANKANARVELHPIRANVFSAFRDGAHGAEASGFVRVFGSVCGAVCGAGYRERDSGKWRPAAEREVSDMVVGDVSCDALGFVRHSTTEMMFVRAPRAVATKAG